MLSGLWAIIYSKLAVVTVRCLPGWPQEPVAASGEAWVAVSAKPVHSGGRQRRTRHPSRDPYVTEGARLSARVLQPFGWPPERLQRCMDACEQHHAPRSRMAMGLEVELVRQADLVDVTAGIVNFGPDPGWLRALLRNIPRDGFWRLVGRSVLGELRHRPASLTAVFFAPRHTRL